MAASRRAATVVLAAATVLLVASIAFAATNDDDGRWSMMRFGPGVMGYAASGDGDPVGDIAEARQRAAGLADRLDLRVGEVMQFSNHYYAELVEDDGRPATEVLVNPRTGAVWLEYGPAMMWNTRYGMMSGGGMMGGSDMMRGGEMTGPGGMMGGAAGEAITPGATGGVDVSPAEAERIASRWLANDGDGLTAGEVEAFPGYYTLHVLRDGDVAGMLSVNAATGSVWQHSWHGEFVGMDG